MALFFTIDFSAYFKYADFRRYPYSAAQELLDVGTESENNRLYLKIDPCNAENTSIIKGVKTTTTQRKGTNDQASKHRRMGQGVVCGDGRCYRHPQAS